MVPYGHHAVFIAFKCWIVGVVLHARQYNSLIMYISHMCVHTFGGNATLLLINIFQFKKKTQLSYA